MVKEVLQGRHKRFTDQLAEKRIALIVDGTDASGNRESSSNSFNQGFSDDESLALTDKRDKPRPSYLCIFPCCTAKKSYR